MTINITLNALPFTSYDSDIIPRAGEAVDFVDAPTGQRKLVVVSVTHLIYKGYSGKVGCDSVLVDTKEV